LVATVHHAAASLSCSAFKSAIAGERRKTKKEEEKDKDRDRKKKEEKERKIKLPFEATTMADLTMAE